MPALCLTFLAGLFLCSAAGCPHRFDFGPDPVRDPAALLAGAREGLATPSTLRGEAKLKFRLPQGRFGADHLVALEVPDQLRLDTLSFFGSPLSVLLLRGETLLLWDIEGGHAYRGPATASTLAMLLPLRLEPAEVIDLILGAPPRMPASRTKLILDHAARAYRVDLRGDGGREQRWFDPTTGHLLRLRSEPDDGEGWEVTYDDYRPFGEPSIGELPFTVRYTRGDTGLIWRWRSLEPDAADFSEAVFDLALPPGIDTVELGEAPSTWLPPESAAPAKPAAPD